MLYSRLFTQAFNAEYELTFPFYHDLSYISMLIWRKMVISEVGGNSFPAYDLTSVSKVAKRRETSCRTWLSSYVIVKYARFPWKT